MRGYIIIHNAIVGYVLEHPEGWDGVRSGSKTSHLGDASSKEGVPMRRRDRKSVVSSVGYR